MSGDGASVEGGEAAHHHQTLRMAEHIFARVHGENALQAGGGACVSLSPNLVAVSCFTHLFLRLCNPLRATSLRTTCA